MAKGLTPKVVITGEGLNEVLTITIPLKAATEARVESESGKSLLLSSVMPKDDAGTVVSKNYGTIRIGLNVMVKNPAFNATAVKQAAAIQAKIDAMQGNITQEAAIALVLKNNPGLKREDLGKIVG